MVAVHTSMVSGEGGGLQKNSGLMKKVVSGEAKPLFKANPTYPLVWENIRHFWNKLGNLRSKILLILNTQKLVKIIE